MPPNQPSIIPLVIRNSIEVCVFSINAFISSDRSKETAYKDEKWIDTMYTHFPPKSSVVYNYATGGNLVNSSRMPEKFVMTQNPSKDMIAQVNSFEYIDDRVEWSPENSLFISWFGMYVATYSIYSIRWRTLTVAWYNSNDIDAISVLTDIGVEEARTILRADMSDYWDQIARLYEHGARKFIHVYVPRMSSATQCHF